MSRESLRDFIHSVVHNQSLRRQVAACSNDEDLIKIARSHHFIITKEDLKIDNKSSQIEAWFKNSKISTSFRTQNDKLSQ